MVRAVTRHGHGTLTLIDNAIGGPFVAIISFACSVGNVPLAARTASPAGPMPRRPEPRQPEPRQPVPTRIRDRGAAGLLRDRDRRGGTVSFPAAVTPAC